MARSLFDASRIAGPPSKAEGDGDGAWTVSLLTQRIEEALKAGLPARVRVIGEISTPNHRSHWYFNLKDESAVISCVMFASDAKRSTALPAHGGRVIARGRIQHYPKQGRTQLYVERLENVGEGDLDARLKRLIDELRAEGYFDDEHKSALPTFPRRIGVITSRTGAALQDVLDTMRRRCPTVEALVIDTRVQGEDAGERIASLVEYLDEHADALGLDALLITRGGGSLEDLWCFNDRALADAIWDCALPVVCAIGHETDTTVCELVADRRCATPTQAAMALTPDSGALREQIDMMRRRLTHAARSRLTGATRDANSIARLMSDLDPAHASRTRLERASRTLAHAQQHSRTQQHLRLERLAARLGANRPESAHAERLHTVERSSLRLQRAMRRRLATEDMVTRARRFTEAVRHEHAERTRWVDAIERELILVSPASVLGRGYSITSHAETGTVIRSPEDASAGTPLLTRVEGGTLRSRVEDRGTSKVPSPTSPLPPRRRARRRKDDPEQMGLF